MSVPQQWSCRQSNKAVDWSSHLPATVHLRLVLYKIFHLKHKITWFDVDNGITVLSSLTFNHSVITQRGQMNYTFRPITLSLAVVSLFPCGSWASGWPSFQDVSWCKDACAGSAQSGERFNVDLASSGMQRAPLIHQTIHPLWAEWACAETGGELNITARTAWL